MAHVVGFDVGFAQGKTELACQLHTRTARYAAQDIVPFGCYYLAVADHEEVVACSLGDKAVLISQQRLGTGLHLSSLQLGDLVEDAAAIFGLGVDVARGHRLLGRDDEVRPLLIEMRHPADVPHQREYIDGDNGICALLDEGIVQRQGTARDVVHNLEVQRADCGQVAGNGLVGRLFHRVNVQPAVDLRVFERAVEPL